MNNHTDILFRYDSRHTQWHREDGLRHDRLVHDDTPQLYSFHITPQSAVVVRIFPLSS